MAGGDFYWCVRHTRVETADDVCPGRYRLGPFPTREGAEHAMDTVQARNEAADAEDERDS